MSDFCKQCSEYYFGEDFNDLAGLVTVEQVAQGFAATVLCEGCGEIIQVNHEGVRVDAAWTNPEDKHVPMEGAQPYEGETQAMTDNTTPTVDREFEQPELEDDHGQCATPKC